MKIKGNNSFFKYLLGMIIAILLFIPCLCGCKKKNSEKISKGFDLKQLEEDCKKKWRKYCIFPGWNFNQSLGKGTK